MMVGFDVGDIVYFVYSPTKCGKVLSTDKDGIEVKWLKKGNPIEIVSAGVLRSYQDLLRSTYRKYTTHADRYDKAKAL